MFSVHNSFLSFNPGIIPTELLTERPRRCPRCGNTALQSHSARSTYDDDGAFTLGCIECRYSIDLTTDPGTGALVVLRPGPKIDS